MKSHLLSGSSVALAAFFSAPALFAQSATGAAPSALALPTLASPPAASSAAASSAAAPGAAAPGAVGAPPAAAPTGSSTFVAPVNVGDSNVEAPTTPAPLEAPDSATGDISPPEPATPPPASIPVAPAAVANEPAAADTAPEPPAARLDYSDGSFYMRAIDDNIVLVPSARMHIDTYGFAGEGVSRYQKDNGSGLKTNLFFRRFVMELGGMIRKQWFFWLGGNFGPTAVDGSQSSTSTSNVYDGFIGYMPTEHLRLYVGQYNAPYSMENVTSSRWLDLMERALVVRTVATPYNKAEGFMAWGETAGKGFEYQLGVFGGDGMNRPNIDDGFDGMGRVLVRPLIGDDGHGNRFHVGVGARYGNRDRTFIRYDAPALSTPGGFTFWSPKYGTGADETRILPEGGQFSGAFELYAPIQNFDIKSEVIYVNEGRSEALASDRATNLRKGTFEGVGGYLQVGFWALGSARITGNPAGYYGITKLPKDVGKQDPHALQVVARAELMRLHYDGNARSGSEATGSYAATTHIDVNAYQFGVNYWATKHVRLSAQYSLYQFPASDNQAAAPARKVDATSDAGVLHELSLRLGLAL